MSSCKPSRSEGPVCPSIALLIPVVPPLGKNHSPHYQETGLSVKKMFHQWSCLPSLPSSLLQVHVFCLKDHGMHCSEMYMLPLILGRVLPPTLTPTQICPPSLTPVHRPSWLRRNLSKEHAHRSCQQLGWYRQRRSCWCRPSNKLWRG